MSTPKDTNDNRVMFCFGLGSEPERFSEGYESIADTVDAAMQALHDEHGGPPEGDDAVQPADFTIAQCDFWKPGDILAKAVHIDAFIEEAEEHMGEDEQTGWLDDSYFDVSVEAAAWLQTKFENACREAAMRFELTPKKLFTAVDPKVHTIEVRLDDAVKTTEEQERIKRDVAKAIEISRDKIPPEMRDKATGEPLPAPTMHAADGSTGSSPDPSHDVGHDAARPGEVVTEVGATHEVKA